MAVDLCQPPVGETMSGLTREAFRLLLEQAIQQSMDLAQQQVSEPLPKALRLELAGSHHRSLSLEEVISGLYRDGTFPRIVDVFVQGIADEQTLIFLRPSGHPATNDLALTWNQPAGMGPFKSQGLLLPVPIFQRPRPLSRQDLEEAVIIMNFVRKLHPQVGSSTPERPRPGRLCQELLFGWVNVWRPRLQAAVLRLAHFPDREQAPNQWALVWSASPAPTRADAAEQSGPARTSAA